MLESPGEVGCSVAKAYYNHTAHYSTETSVHDAFPSSEEELHGENKRAMWYAGQSCRVLGTWSMLSLHYIGR